jgi:hypothetical protein
MDHDHPVFEVRLGFRSVQICLFVDRLGVIYAKVHQQYRSTGHLTKSLSGASMSFVTCAVRSINSKQEKSWNESTKTYHRSSAIQLIGAMSIVSQALRYATCHFAVAELDQRFVDFVPMNHPHKLQSTIYRACVLVMCFKLLKNYNNYCGTLDPLKSENE